MIKTFKWIYRLGYDNARNSIITKLERAHEDHLKLAQIASYRNDYKYDQPRMSATDHDRAAKTIYEILNHLDPKQYPNMEALEVRNRTDDECERKAELVKRFFSDYLEEKQRFENEQARRAAGIEVEHE